MDKRMTAEAMESETAFVPETDETAEGNALPLKRNKYADKMNRPKKKLPKGVKAVIWILILAGLIAGGVYVVKKTGDNPKETAEKTAIAERGFLETYIEGDGMTAAKKRVELGADLKGVVTDVLVNIGDQVKAGQKLFTVDPKETRKELDDAVEALNSAQAELRKAQEALGQLTVRAPFNGKLIPMEQEEGGAEELRLNVGEELASGTTLGMLVDDSYMKLELYFSYAYINDIAAGANATVSIPVNMSNIPGKVEKVEKIEKISSDGTKLFRVTVSMKNPGALKSGMMATATIGGMTPAEAGKLQYTREQKIVTEAGGKLVKLSGMYYCRFRSGETILAMSNLESAESIASQKKMIASKQEEVNRLNQLIAGAQVVSPIDGMVVSLPISVEEELTGTTVPCVVADMTAIVVNADIQMTDVSSVMPGQPATITMYTGEGDQVFTGTVKSVSMEARKDAGGQGGGQGGMPMFPAVIEIDAVEGQVLRPDYSVQYKITTAQAEDCIMVPSAAVVNTESGTAVFARPMEGEVIENAMPLPEGTEGIPEDFVLVPVVVGISDAANTEIVEGISEGTTVFLSGPEDLYKQQEGDGPAMAG